MKPILPGIVPKRSGHMDIIMLIALYLAGWCSGAIAMIVVLL